MTNEYISPHNYRTLMIPWMISSVLSMIGSLTIIISSIQRFHRSMYQRLIGIISICDLIISTNFILEPILVPSYASYQYGWLWATGTSLSCTITGIISAFTHLLMTCYTLGIMLFFYSKVKHNIPEHKIQKTYEKSFHMITILFSIIIVTIVSFNVGIKPSPAYYVCFPSYCELDDMNDCKFHFDDRKFLFSQLYAISVSTLTTLSLIALYGIYKTVNETKRRVQEHYESQFNSSNINQSQEIGTNSMNNNNTSSLNHINNINNDIDNARSGSQSSFFSIRMTTMGHRRIQRKEKNRRLLAIRNQAILYMLVAFNSTFSIWIFFLLQIIQSYTSTSTSSSTPTDDDYDSVSFLYLKMIAYIMLPIQGFLIFLVYTRPRYLEYRKVHPHMGRFYAFTKAISLKPCPLYTTYNSNNTNNSNDNIIQQQHQQQGSWSSNFLSTIMSLSTRILLHKRDANTATTMHDDQNNHPHGDQEPNSHDCGLCSSHSGSSSSKSNSSLRRDNHYDHNDSDIIGQQQEIWKLPNVSIQIMMNEKNHYNTDNKIMNEINHYNIDNKNNTTDDYIDSISSSCQIENEFDDDNNDRVNINNKNSDVRDIHSDDDSDSTVVIEFFYNDNDDNDDKKDGIKEKLSGEYAITLISEQTTKKNAAADDGMCQS